jgi:hypothetical protein
MSDPRDEQPSERAPGAEEPVIDDERDDRRYQARFKRMLSDLLDSGAALRRGSQEIVTGVAVGTKEELVRMATGEIRGFLEKLDVADIVQDIVAGLVIEVKAEIKFSRDPSTGKITSKVTTQDVATRTSATVAPRPEEPKVS